MLSLSMYLSVLNGISTGNELSVLDNNVFSNYVIGGVIILSYVFDAINFFRKASVS